MTFSPSTQLNSDQDGFVAAQSAIEILLDLAQRGEINPWDVQVIDVIDRYLTDVGVDKGLDTKVQEADLPQSGQAFVWASMLVLLKAQTLQLIAEEPPDLEEITTEIVTTTDQPLPKHLENYLHRRAAAPPPRRRRVTLEELIEQIKQMAVVLDSPRRPSPKLTRGQSRRESAQTISELAHSEDLTETAKQLETFLEGGWSQLSLENDWLDLEVLLQLWGRNSPDSAKQGTKKDRVGVFWALLLLSAQSKVELSQEEFYQDLKVRFLK